jgi:hypothetical protein
MLSRARRTQFFGGRQKSQQAIPPADCVSMATVNSGPDSDIDFSELKPLFGSFMCVHLPERYH